MRTVRGALGWLLLSVAVLYFWLGMLAWAVREWETSNGVSYAWDRAILTEPLPAELAAVPKEAWVSPRPLVLSIKAYRHDKWWRIPLARGITLNYPEKIALAQEPVADRLTLQFTSPEGVNVDIGPDQVRVSGMTWDSPSAEEVHLPLSRSRTF